MTFTFKARHALGESIEGECLVANDGFSARYDLDRINGTFSRPNHKLFGQSYHNKILILNTAKGGVATAWMLYEMKARNLFPLAIVLNSANPILAQGAAHAGIPLLSGFDIDITDKVPNGAKVKVNPLERTITII